MEEGVEAKQQLTPSIPYVQNLGITLTTLVMLFSSHCSVGLFLRKNGGITFQHTLYDLYIQMLDKEKSVLTGMLLNKEEEDENDIEHEHIPVGKITHL